MKEGTKKVSAMAGIISSLIVGIYVLSNMSGSIITPLIEEEQMPSITMELGALGAEADPGAGASGFLEIFFINQSKTPGAAYLQNDSATLEAWCVANMTGKTPYATADNFNVSLEHSVYFNIVVRCRFNKTHAWNGTMFRNDSCRVNITLTGDIVISDVTGTNVESLNDTSKSFIWINTYWDNSGAGYILWKDQNASITEISIEAKY